MNQRHDPHDRDHSLSELLAIDQICRRFEAACKAGKAPPLDEFLANRPEPQRSQLRRELESIVAACQKPAKGSPPLETFVKNLTASRLMTAEEYQSFYHSIPANTRPTTAEELAQELFRQGRLTRFQTQAVYQGKTRGLVLGTYVVLDKLGEGGMGQVYKAEHRKMQRIVALKVLPASATRSPEAVQRFQREVRAAARLSHPNIVTAHDADEAQGMHFLVMEYVEGQDLASLVKSQGALPVAAAVDYVIQAARALEYAHRQGVIHRDVKPSNLLLDKQGQIKILDMGLARIDQTEAEAEHAAEEHLTQVGQVMGTLHFMSPEQALDSRQTDARSDIYSLGCTLHYLLTGRPPYGGNTLAQKILAHREQPVPSLRAARADVAEDLDAVFQRMLAKHPDERQSSMAAVIAQLAACTLSCPPSPAAAPPANAGGMDTRQPHDQDTPRPNATVSRGTEDFNAYHRWLGITPKDQPPHHYRMLGIELFESDAEVIRDAAGRQSAHVRSYQLGKHSTLSQKILNEIAAAKTCLINAQRKAAYDQALQESLAAQEKAPAAAASPAEAQTPPPEALMIETVPPQSGLRAWLGRVFPGTRLPPNVTLAVALGVAAVVFLLGLIVMLRTSEDTLVVKTGLSQFSVTASAGTWIELLDGVDVMKRDRLSGVWRRDADGITVTLGREAQDPEPADHRQVMVPAEVPANYDLEVQFTRRTGNNGVAVLFPVGKVVCGFVLSSWAGEASGLELIDNRDARDNPSTRRPGKLKNDHKYTAVIQVRLHGAQASVDVSLDGKPYLSWTGAQSALTTPWAGGRLIRNNRLSLCTWDSTATFHSVRMRGAATTDIR